MSFRVSKVYKPQKKNSKPLLKSNEALHIFRKQNTHNEIMGPKNGVKRRLTPSAPNTLLEGV